MKKEIPQRIAIIGLPGSGKSTFANKLGNIFDIPVYHLDKHMWAGSGKKRDKNEFLSIQKEMVEKELWIIEGCSISTLEMRFSQADTVIYFQLPRLTCLWRVFKRLFIRDKSDTGCANVVNLKLLKYIWNFENKKRERIEEFKKKYPQVDFIVFKNSREAEEYLQKFKR